MKVFCLFLASTLLTLFTNARCQPVNYRNDALLLKQTILQKHISPRKIDDRFSQWVYNDFLDELDPDRLYFTEQELQTLGLYKRKLDDELNGSGWAFLPLITQTYSKCLKRAQRITEQLLQTPFDLTVNENFTPDTLWAKNETEIKERWRLVLKYEILSRLQELRNADAGIAENKFLQNNEPEARQRTKAGITRSIQRISNHASGFENYIGSLYLQAIALAFDPHSAYLSPTAMENFLSSLSSKGYYFGLMLNENEKGEIVIDQLTPGGSAWKSGVLNTGDIIRKVKWDGKETVDLYGVSLDEMNDLLLETNHSSLEITVTKAGGLPETIVLHKEMMEAEENIVKSFILQGKRKIGYISLPDFYTNWGEQEGARCANDVAKEVIKLKKENIDGLILDLRFNGGGSIQEAVAMAGIFIDAGPIGLILNKAGEIFTIKDINRGTVYEGPLVLLVNGMSASASEFLAAALQDYQRAIIVGSRTYGKATAQSLFALDPRNPAAKLTSSIKPGIGYASVTLEKIYRITGKTVQAHGIEPHIVLPDIYDSLEFREELMPLALPHDSVFKKTYYEPLVLLPVRELKFKSETRVRQHTGFEMVKNASELLSREQNDKPVSLLWTTFNKFAEQKINAFKQIEKGDHTASAAFTVGSHNFEVQRMKMDPFIEAFNRAWIKKLERDISLEESFHIICDYIDITMRK